MTSTETVINNYYYTIGTNLYEGHATARIPIEMPEGAADLRQQMAAAKPKNKRRDWFRIENAADEMAEVFIYDEITDPLWAEFGLGISAKSFADELHALKGKAITLHINSPGGSVFEGTAIYNLIRQHDAPVNVIVDGIAASIASVIAMAGTTVTMAPHSMLMIHEASGFTMGNAAVHEQQAAILNKLSDNIASVYRERGDSRINWRQKMLDETWITAEEAVQWKLADRIDDAADPAQNRFDLSRFRNPPTDLAVSMDEEAARAKRTVEDVLRDECELTNREVKAVVSEVWKVKAARDESGAADQSDETSPTDVTEATADESTVTVDEFPLELAKDMLALARSR
jgi:ATP-dependent protease ClpP protease subunit